MSMPQPIHVALVGATSDIVRRAKKHFRLSTPGIGAAFLATLERTSTEPIIRFEDLPNGLITLWITLDHESLSASRQRHDADLLNPCYCRGFYEHHLPESCVLVDFEKSWPASKKQLARLSEQIAAAWYATS
nr:hypothetical protein [Pirellula staleyi]